MSEPGEMEVIADIARVDTAVITNIGGYAYRKSWLP